MKKVLITEAQKRGRMSKNKGANYERKIAKIFKEKCEVELTRTPQSGGFAKKSTKADSFRGDIVCLEEGKDLALHLECKSQKVLSIPSWVRQAEEDCPQDKIPCVIYHLENTSKELITLKVNDFIELLSDNKRGIETTRDTDFPLIMEEWKPVKDYSDYLVSNLGRVVSQKKGCSPRELKPGIGTTGYYNIALCKEGKCRTVRIHRLVAEHYLPRVEGYNIVNHIDGNKLNNRVDNLEWSNHSHNLSHAYINNLRSSGFSSKLSNKDILLLKIASLKGEDIKKLVPQDLVSDITFHRIVNEDYRNYYNLYLNYKNQKSLSMRKWIEQAEDDCPQDKIPCVIYHLGQTVKDGKVKDEKRGDYITLKLEDFLKLVDKKEIIKEC